MAEEAVAPVAVPTTQEQPTPQPAPAQVTTVTSPSVTATAAAATAAVASPQANGNAASPVAATSSAASRPSEELTCMWQGCSEKLPTPESLYEHVCERHVGRKSTNNLNLTCQWGSCRTTTVKRDHITSHIRVHVPLKPHKCDFCGKAFKRPQDLKKHVKTHADDSVLVRSPEPGSRNPDMMFGGGAKGYAAAAHYFEPALNPVPSQGYAHGPPQYYQAHHAPQPSNASYGNVYYALNTGPEPHQASYENKKRGYDALNEFFGDLKRRQFDPNSYAAVGQRLLSLQNLSLPVLTAAPLAEYQPMPAPVAVAGGPYASGPHPAPAYHLPPMSNVRTKSDLINIDQFLQQMQDTIYENDDNVAAAGVAQPGAHYIHNGMSYRTTHSPPTQLPSAHATAHTAGPILTNTSAHSPSASTPALTPPSSAQSYTSGRSPISLPSAHRVSPPHESGPSMYPRLPSATDAMAAGYPAASSAAPPSTLGGIFDSDERRRYTGGTLQRARPVSRAASEAMDLSSDDKESGERTPKQISASLIDPALHGGSPNEDDVTRTAKAATEVAERSDVQSEWVEKVRLIEYLRNYIAHRLEQGEFNDEMEQDNASRSPVSKVDDDMEGVESHSLPRSPRTVPIKTDNETAEDTVMYPTLRGLDEDGDSKMPS
ncbi:putative C2H2 transcription factor PacC [Aspergillus mulundensis]|uniref:pH-response transcription factor pacC/RIM101 n=1 Tax=Aspergillus mulundensis TaxID=1810919 RepID=A0A3D8SJM5_9EURO|nr:pH-response transcription factor pacC [Aspergillus mulundensis]RDW86520.1 pH-response transcription factor pacC [Aspergillus mulundensis]